MCHHPAAAAASGEPTTAPAAHRAQASWQPALPTLHWLQLLLGEPTPNANAQECHSMRPQSSGEWQGYCAAAEQLLAAPARSPSVQRHRPAPGSIGPTRAQGVARATAIVSDGLCAAGVHCAARERRGALPASVLRAAVAQGQRGRGAGLRRAVGQLGVSQLLLRVVRPACGKRSATTRRPRGRARPMAPHDSPTSGRRDVYFLVKIVN